MVGYNCIQFDRLLLDAVQNMFKVFAKISRTAKISFSKPIIIASGNSTLTIKHFNQQGKLEKKIVE